MRISLPNTADRRLYLDITTKDGLAPTGTVASIVLVLELIKEAVLESWFVTQIVLPSGVTAIPIGLPPARMGDCRV
jgi:hypothetical protein